MQNEIAIGTITPSGNRTVERLTQSICRELDGVVPLFTRIPVYGSTSPEKGGSGPYDWSAMLRAAELLSHADPQAICWNGSKGGEFGFDVDERLCADIQAATGIPAVTSALAVVKLLRMLDVERVALVTPYTQAGQAKCIAGFEGKGFTIVGERHGGLTDNLSFGSVSPDDIAEMARAAVRWQFRAGNRILLHEFQRRGGRGNPRERDGPAGHRFHGRRCARGAARCRRRYQCGEGLWQPLRALTRDHP